MKSCSFLVFKGGNQKGKNNILTYLVWIKKKKKNLEILLWGGLDEQYQVFPKTPEKKNNTFQFFPMKFTDYKN